MKTKITEEQINHLIERLEGIKDTFSEITLRSPQWLKFLSQNSKMAEQITGMHEDLGWHLEGINDKESLQKTYHEAIEAFIAGDSEPLKIFIEENNLFYYFFMHKFSPKVEASKQKSVPLYIEILEAAHLAFKKFQEQQKPIDNKSLIAHLVKNLQGIKHPGSENIQDILLQKRNATEVTEQGKNFLQHVIFFALLSHYQLAEPIFFNSLPYQIRQGNPLLLDFSKQIENGKKEAYMALLKLIQTHLFKAAKATDESDKDLFSRSHLKDIDTNFLKKWFSTFPPKTQAHLQKIGYKPLSSGSDVRGNFLLACKGCCNETNAAGFENIAMLMQDSSTALNAEGKAFLQSPEVGFIIAHYALEHKTAFYTLLPKAIQNAYNPNELNEEGLFLAEGSAEYLLSKMENPKKIQTPKKGFLALFQSIEETYRLGKPTETLAYYDCAEESLFLFIKKHFVHFPTLVQEELKEVLVRNPMRVADELCALSPVQGISYSLVPDHPENLFPESITFHFKTVEEKKCFMGALQTLAHNDALSGKFAEQDDGILLSIPCLKSFNLSTFSSRYLYYFKPHYRQAVERKAHALLAEIDALDHVLKVDPNQYKQGNDAFNKTLPIQTVQYIFETAEKRDAFAALLTAKGIPSTYVGETRATPKKPIVELSAESVMRLTVTAVKEIIVPLDSEMKAPLVPTQSNEVLLLRQAVESKAHTLLTEIDALDHVFKVNAKQYQAGNDAFNKRLPIETVQYIFETAEKRDAFAALLKAKDILYTYVGETRAKPQRPIVELPAESVMLLNIQQIEEKKYSKPESEISKKPQQQQSSSSSGSQEEDTELFDEDVYGPNEANGEKLNPIKRRTLPAKALSLLAKYEEKRKEYTHIILPSKEKIERKLLRDQKISGIYPADITAIFRKLNQFARNQKQESVENLKKMKIKALANLCWKHYEELCANQNLNPNEYDLKTQDPELALFKNLTDILRKDTTVDNKFAEFRIAYDNQKIQFSCLDKFLASIDFLGIFNVTHLIDIDRAIKKISETDYSSPQNNI